jgi:integrase
VSESSTSDAGPAVEERISAMASLYRPKIVVYRLRDGSYRTPSGERVTKDTPGAVRSVEVSKKWYGRYTKNGHLVREPLSESKETARRMLAKLVGDAQLASVGLENPYLEHQLRTVAEHVEDYRRFLAGKGNTASHVKKTIARIKAFLKSCRLSKLDDLRDEPVIDFLAALCEPRRPQLELPKKEQFTKAETAAILGVNGASIVRMLRVVGFQGTGNGKARRYPRAALEACRQRLGQGASVETRNHYLTAIKGFTRWLARNHRLPNDPLAYLSRQNPDVDVRHPRRALPELVFARFIEATAEGKPFRGLSGPDRLILYTLAANTGFRANELASLTPASFDFRSAPPTVTVQAGYSKRRRKDVQPLRPDVAQMIKSFIGGLPRNEPLWPGTWASVGAEMIRVDLAAAAIPYLDEDSRCFDMHALRGQFISLLAARGVHPKVAQALARHSSITLTMDYYTHLDVLDVAGALDSLPEVPTKVQKPQKPERDWQGAGKALPA